MRERKDWIAKTESGLLRGFAGYDPRITVFKGVPYAEPPVGELRWQPPRKKRPWEGVRDAAQYGPIAVQPVPGSDPADFWTKEIYVNGPELAMSEDCLYMNIFTPAKSEGEKLPVLCYIHGGGFLTGYPHEVEFDWEHMARKGIVVAAITYRLNVFGFFAHPSMTDDEGRPVCNFGLRDQLFAVEWIRRNIAAFGGDPSRITIAGQSAGAGSVQCLMTSAMAEPDLIAGAIIESGVTMNFHDFKTELEAQPPETAFRDGEELLRRLGVSDVEEAKLLPPERILSAGLEDYGPGMHFQPVVDGVFLKETPCESVRRGHCPAIPSIAGYTRDEARPFMRMFGKLPETVAELMSFAGRYKDAAGDFLALADAKNDDDVRALFLTEAYTDLICGSRMYARFRERAGAPVYVYEFDGDIPGSDHPGSFHGSEMFFCYDGLDRSWRPFTGRHYDLARQMSSYWANFVKTGNPNGRDSADLTLPEWRPCAEKDPFRLAFREAPEPAPFEDSALMEFRMGFADKE